MCNPVDIARRFTRLRALVVGDSLLDSYYEGTAARLSPEGPVPVVKARRKIFLPGGAANTAVNTRSLGAEVNFLSVVGADDTARILRAALVEHGIPLDCVLEDSVRTSVNKLRIIADSQFTVRFDEGDTCDLRRESEDRLIASFRKLSADCDVVIVSDYLCGVVTPRFLAEMARLNEDGHMLIVGDSKDLKFHQFSNVTVVTPNHIEARDASRVRMKANEDISLDGYLEKVGWDLLARIRTRSVVVTLGAEGAVLFERGKPPLKVRARPIESPQAIGAGDTFTAALGLSLAAGADSQTAMAIATEAAAIATSKERTAAVTQQELLQRLSLVVPAGTTRPAQVLDEVVENYRRDGKKIVFTNGCFDILHGGHITYLRQAKALGDVLIVGINSDDSVRRLKGEKRPINPQEDRASVVAALEYVDHVVLFDEDTPERLIREIRPHVHVKGGDYEAEKLPEAQAVRDVGGKIAIIPLIQGKSSSLIIETIARITRP
ncbi:MAG: D-glycero-beta-D-manno-heptose 1-phosphate adenylyltransferase [Chloroflexi bacterium]|nr:D-glycero-beta-D-manno-heptose 1-phosphate adenylyltransferase [Chloroflexota bacterium]